MKQAAADKKAAKQAATLKAQNKAAGRNSQKSARYSITIF